MAPSSGPDLTDEKRALRREMGERRAAISAGERLACSEAAAARLLALPELASLGGRTIAAYVAAKGELDPAAALAEAVARGATVALPRVAQAAMTPRLRFHRADAGPLVPGAFDLLEPAPTAPEVPLDALDLVLVPGLAFDAAGGRLGFGGGYYDGAFVGARRPTLIGLAYDFQIVPCCPAGDGDVPVDLVVTDRRVLRAVEGRR